MLNLLAEYTDASGGQKLDKLVRLMYAVVYDEDEDDDNTEEFKKLLFSLPVDSVGWNLGTLVCSRPTWLSYELITTPIYSNFLCLY